MRLVTRNNMLSSIFFLLSLIPSPVYAIPAITCHCFTDRTYDPGHPVAADGYFLATIQNTFFALMFSVDKKSIVMKKQQGIASDDLWIAYWIAAKKRTSADFLLKVKQSSDVWKDVFTTLHVDSQPFGTCFSKALNTKVSSATLAEIAVDELFLRNHILKDADLAALRQ